MITGVGEGAEFVEMKGAGVVPARCVGQECLGSWCFDRRLLSLILKPALRRFNFVIDISVLVR